MSAVDDIRRIVVESVAETFAAYDIACIQRATAAAPDDADAHLVVATIGLANDALRGGLVLTMEASSVNDVRPPGLDGDDDLIAQEVLGAFVNMLAGRVKNKLIPRGLIFCLGTPMTASGRGMRLAADPSVSTWHEFALGAGEACASIRIDLRAEALVELLSEPDPGAEPIQCEGEITLF